jgi:predicted RNase H-like HicB family nuclease
MKRYTVRYERDEDGWWVASVPAIKGCHTQGRSVAQARERIREALGLFVKDARRAEFDEEFRLPAELSKVVARTAAARARAEKQGALASLMLKDAAKLLEKQGLSVRDAGQLLGLSHQRINQLRG